MEIIMDLPLQGLTTIWVVVDCFMKITHFVPLSKLSSTLQMAEIFFKKIFCLYGLPTHSDQEVRVQFVSNFWRAVWKALKISLCFLSQNEWSDETNQLGPRAIPSDMCQAPSIQLDRIVTLD